MYSVPGILDAMGSTETVRNTNRGSTFTSGSLVIVPVAGTVEASTALAGQRGGCTVRSTTRPIKEY